MKNEAINKEAFEYKRKSYMEIGDIFFWTATINKWQRLLEDEMYKKIFFAFVGVLKSTTPSLCVVCRQRSRAKTPASGSLGNPYLSSF